MQCKSRVLIIFLIYCFIAGIKGRFLKKERIYGGSVAGIGEFPYMVSLRRDGVHDCGGALIGTKHVLTAYHCIRKGYENLNAVLGTNSLTRGGEAYRVVSALVYPPFDGQIAKDVYDHDIAVLTLEREVKLDRLMSIVPLPDSEVVSGSSAEFTGWGDDYSGRNTKFLQKLQVTTVSNDVCESGYETYGYGYLVTNHTLCTYRDFDYGACFGDSGAPLVQDGKIVGVLSIGFDQCAIGVPDLFESVHYYLDFIKYAISQ